MKKAVVVIFAVISMFGLRAQTISSDKVVDWSKSGFKGMIPSYSSIVNVLEHGFSNDGVTYRWKRSLL